MKNKLSLSVCFLLGVFTPNFAQVKSQHEQAAKEYIISNANTLGYVNNSNLELYFVRAGDTGETVRFNQLINGVPIYKGDIAIHFNKANTISSVAETTYTKNFKKINTTPSITAQQALQIANLNSPPKGNVTHEETKLFLYNKGEGDTHLAYQVVVASSEKQGEWETMVDAHNGEILNVEDISSYAFHSHNPKKKSKLIGPMQEPSKRGGFETGTAYVFDPDPLSRMGVQYGGAYVDGNDATNASLDAARTLVTLPEITNNNGVYYLTSSYANVIDFETPTTGLFTQASPNFLFNRFDQGFEAVNAFYHIHQNMAYINETLGINCRPTLNNNLVVFDPHGVQGSDNSYFQPSSQRLSFGEGCVDDAEDADVIIHELGHGIHYWITGRSSSSAQGLGEGSGDYWAASYSRSLNQWPSTAPEYNWMFNWDGHNTCWAGRVTNFAATYPTSTINNSGSIHSNGQIWASCLMRIYDRIGKLKTDRIFLEGLARTNSSSNQQTAAVAVRQAAIDLLGTHGFTCTDIDIITAEMTTTGYTLPTYNCILSTKEIAAETSKVSLYPNPATDHLMILSTNENMKGVIYNAEGRNIMNIKVSKGSNKINVQSLSTGNYIFSLENGESHKFIKK